MGAKGRHLGNEFTLGRPFARDGKRTLLLESDEVRKISDDEGPLVNDALDIS